MLRLHRFFCCDEVGIRKVSIDEEHGSSPTVNPRLIDDEDSNRYCKSDVASSFPEKSRLRQHLQVYLSFSSSATNQDILVKTLQWPLFSLGMYQLACQVSYARYVTRLFGFPAAVDAARRTLKFTITYTSGWVKFWPSLWFCTTPWNTLRFSCGCNLLLQSTTLGTWHHGGWMGILGPAIAAVAGLSMSLPI